MNQNGQATNGSYTAMAQNGAQTGLSWAVHGIVLHFNRPLGGWGTSNTLTTRAVPTSSGGTVVLSVHFQTATSGTGSDNGGESGTFAAVRPNSPQAGNQPPSSPPRQVSNQPLPSSSTQARSPQKLTPAGPVRTNSVEPQSLSKKGRAHWKRCINAADNKAFAKSKSCANFGWRMGFKSIEKSKQVALQTCNADDCRVISVNGKSVAHD